MENETITLKCFHCGTVKNVAIDGNVNLGSRLVNIANKARMINCIDLYRGRILVFCNEECQKKHTTRKGTIKARAGYSC